MKKVDLIVIIIFHGKDYITVNIKETQTFSGYSRFS